MNLSSGRAAVLTVTAAFFALASTTVQAQSNKKTSPPPPPKSTTHQTPVGRQVPANRQVPDPVYRNGQPRGYGTHPNGGLVTPNSGTNRGYLPPTPNSYRLHPGTVISHSLPKGQMARTSAGTMAMRTTDGRQYALANNGQVTAFRGVHNTEARFRPDGSVRMVRAGGMTITHGPNGVRQVAAVRPDHTFIVSKGPGRGYVQHPFVVGNRQYVQRTYVVNNITYRRVYQPYAYRGVVLNAYVPIVYHSPALYAWAYSPWRSPVVYRWGWYGSPWYGFYGAYWAPLPSYASPSLWLSDYIVGTTLAEAYQARADAASAAQAVADAPADQVAPLSANSQGQVALTPEVKELVATEVQRQLVREKTDSEAASQNGIPDQAAEGIGQAIDDNSEHAFVVSSALEVRSQGQQCTLTEGDVLGSSGAPPNDATTVPVKVLASQGQDCRAGATVAVSLQDLQEMQNHMRESIDQGLQLLEAHKDGLPKPPGAVKKGEEIAPFAGAIPPPDANASVELSQQEQAAVQAELQVINQAADVNGTKMADLSLAPIDISRGQTIDEVVTNMGRPRELVNLGTKQIYAYDNMKITFENGLVSDVQ